MQSCGVGHQPCRAQIRRLDGVESQMLVEPRPPGQRSAIAGLQHRLHAPAPATLDETQMAPVRRRHGLENDTRLAMFSDADDEAFVMPFHAATRSCKKMAAGRRSSSIAE